MRIFEAEEKNPKLYPAFVVGIRHPMRIGFVTHMSPQSCPTERLWVAAAQHLRHEFGAEIGISIASHPKEDSDAWDKVQPIASAFGERKHEEGTLANRIGTASIHRSPLSMWDGS